MLKLCSQKCLNLANSTPSVIILRKSSSNYHVFTKHNRIINHSNNSLIPVNNNSVNGLLAEFRCSIDKMCLRSISITNVVKEKSEKMTLNDQAEYKSHYNERRQKRIQFYRKNFFMFNYSMVSVLGFILLVSWWYPEERKRITKKHPFLGEFIDYALGPEEGKIEDVNEIEKSEKPS